MVFNMNSSLISKFISTQRLNKYNNFDEYSKNLVFSKNAYIPLSVLEIALRNSVDNLFSHTIGVEWIKNNDFLTKDSIKKIQEAKAILLRRGEEISKSKIIAELSFGFWVNLFKKPYSKNLRIQNLKKIFLNLPPIKEKIINREVLYKQLNHIRNFRNRIFHHEKVLNKDDYNQIFDEIYDILSYFDEEVCVFVKRVNNE